MGSGHALDALLRLKNNRALKQMSKFGYSQFKNVILNTKSKYHHFEDKSTLTPEQLLIYKRKIKKRIAAEKMKIFIKSAIGTIVAGFLIFYISHLLYHYFSS